MLSILKYARPNEIKLQQVAIPATGVATGTGVSGGAAATPHESYPGLSFPTDVADWVGNTKYKLLKALGYYDNPEAVYWNNVASSIKPADGKTIYIATPPASAKSAPVKQVVGKPTVDPTVEQNVREKVKQYMAQEAALQEMNNRASTMQSSLYTTALPPIGERVVNIKYDDLSKNGQKAWEDWYRQRNPDMTDDELLNRLSNEDFKSDTPPENNKDNQDPNKKKKDFVTKVMNKISKTAGKTGRFIGKTIINAPVLGVGADVTSNLINYGGDTDQWKYNATKVLTSPYAGAINAIGMIDSPESTTKDQEESKDEFVDYKESGKPNPKKDGKKPAFQQTI